LQSATRPRNHPLGNATVFSLAAADLSKQDDLGMERSCPFKGDTPPRSPDFGRSDPLFHALAMSRSMTSEMQCGRPFQAVVSVLL